MDTDPDRQQGIIQQAFRDLLGLMGQPSGPLAEQDLAAGSEEVMANAIK